MRRRWPVAVLAVGGAVLLASLYLPWLEGSPPGGSLLDLFTLTHDGWDSRVGDPAAVADLLLIALALAALLKPEMKRRLPLSQAALLAFYLTVGVGVQARTDADVFERVHHGFHYHYAYGAFLGIATAALILVAAAARWNDRPAEDAAVVPLVVASLLACTLLVAFALPWIGFGSSVPIDRGVVVPPGTVAAACAVWFLVGSWSERSTAVTRLTLGAAAALLTGAAFATSSASSLQYGAWLGLGSGLALLAVVVLAERRSVRLSRPADRQLVAVGAAALFVVSLFLVWQTYHLPAEFGHSLSIDGWTLVGTAAGALAVLTVAEAFRFEVVAGFALLVATLGFELAHNEEPGIRIDISYGAKLGFAAAALITLIALSGARPRRIDRLVLLAPIVVCAAYVVIVVLPWWDVLPGRAQEDLRFAGPPSWLTMVGVGSALRLIRAWFASEREWLVVLPAAMLALAAVILFNLRNEGIEWGGGIVVGLSVLLILLGAIECDGGLENFRVPEILRVDRL